MNNIIVSGETIPSAEKKWKMFGWSGLCPDTAAGAHSTPQTPNWWESCCPSRNPTPTLSLRPFSFAPPPQWKILEVVVTTVLKL